MTEPPKVQSPRGHEAEASTSSSSSTNKGIVPAGMAEIATGLRACLQQMGPWSISDLTMGVYAVKGIHEANETGDLLPGTRIDAEQRAELLDHFRREVRIARAAYKMPDMRAMIAEAHGWPERPERPGDSKDKASSEEAVAQDEGSQPRDQNPADLPDATLRILHVETTAYRLKPAFYVALDSASELVRVVVRGTQATSDVLTDIAGHWEEYAGGHAHSGFLNSAHWLLSQVEPLVMPLLEENPEYGLCFSGHSLGAATAALVTHMLRSGHAGDAAAPLAARRPICYALSSPPVLSLDLATASAPYVTTLVVDHDVVVRASLANFEQLRLEVLASGWWQSLSDKVQSSKLAQAAAATLSAVGAGMLAAMTTKMDADAELGNGGAVNNTANRVIPTLHHFYVKPTADVKGHEAARNAASTSMRATLLSSAESLYAAANGMKDYVGGMATYFNTGATVLGEWHAAKKEERSRMSPTEVQAQTRADNAKLALSGFVSTALQAASSAAQALDTRGVSSEKPYRVTNMTPEGVAARRAEEVGPHPDEAAAAAADAMAAAAKDLENAVQALHLYAPGRLYHLQRAKRAEVDQRCKLIEGSPGARFEFIALRDTCVTDHFLSAMLECLNNL